METLAPFAVWPTSCAAGVPKRVTSRGRSVLWHVGQQPCRSDYARDYVCICRSHRLHNSVSSGVWRGCRRDNQSNKVWRHAFPRWVRGWGQMSGNLPSAAKRVTRRSNTSQRALTEHSFGVGGGEKGPHGCQVLCQVSKMVLSNLSSVMETLTQWCFERRTGAARVVGPSVMWTLCVFFFFFK